MSTMMKQTMMMMVVVMVVVLVFLAGGHKRAGIWIWIRIHGARLLILYFILCSCYSSEGLRRGVAAGYRCIYTLIKK